MCFGVNLNLDAARLPRTVAGDDIMSATPAEGIDATASERVTQKWRHAGVGARR